jgi:hypothetical protein
VVRQRQVSARLQSRQEATPVWLMSGATPITKDADFLGSIMLPLVSGTPIIRALTSWKNCR